MRTGEAQRSAMRRTVTENIVLGLMRAGMTRRELSLRLGKSHCFFDLRKNTGNWTLDELMSIASLLNVSVFTLLGKNEERG